MLKKLLVLIPIALSVGAIDVHAGMLPSPGPTPMRYEASINSIAKQEMLLTNRHRNAFVNEVFADNILLNLAYLSGDVRNAKDVEWNEIRKSKQFEFTLKPGEVFAFHDGIMAEFASHTSITTGAHFNAADGFKSSGLLYGDGVCHLASLFNRVARDAGLRVVSPVNHDFAIIPDMPREYGTAIYYDPHNPAVSEQQNLYIQNTRNKPVRFIIETTKEKVTVSIAEN